MSRRALQRAAADTATATTRLAVACLTLGAGYNLTDRLLTRLTIPVALVVTGAILTIGAGWWATVRTDHDLTRLQHRHEDDTESIHRLKATNRRMELDLRQANTRTSHLLAEVHRTGGDVTLPAPRPAVLDEKPRGER